GEVFKLLSGSDFRRRRRAGDSVASLAPALQPEGGIAERAMDDPMPNHRPAPLHPLFSQKTIARPVAISGVGIHTGKLVHLEIHPAPEGTAIVFRRTDRGGVEIPALASEVSSVELATSLGRDDVTISTVEHLLAAIRVCDIDNLRIDLDG